MQFNINNIFFINFFFLDLKNPVDCIHYALTYKGYKLIFFEIIYKNYRSI